VPTREMMISPEMKSCAWHRAFARDSGLILGPEEIWGPPDWGGSARARPINALAVRERVDCFIKTSDEDDVPILQHNIARRPR
jgi:hypothetical protein